MKKEKLNLTNKYKFALLYVEKIQVSPGLLLAVIVTEANFPERLGGAAIAPTVGDVGWALPTKN